MLEYLSFEPQDKYVCSFDQVKKHSKKKNLSVRKRTILLYKGVENDDFQPQKRLKIEDAFCAAGGKSGLLLPFNALMGICDENVREEWFKEYEKNKKAPFIVYQKNGLPAPKMLDKFWVDPSEYKYFKDWNKSMAVKADIAFLNAMGAPAGGFNTYNRFHNPNIAYTLYLSPGKWSEPVTKTIKEALKEECGNLKKDYTNVTFKLVEWDDAIKNKNLILVGDNFFGIYTTWMTKAHVKALWNAVGIDQSKILRVWPTDTAPLEAINKEMDLKKDTKSARNSHLNYNKMNNATGQRDNYRKAGDVMGKTAFEIADKALGWDLGQNVAPFEAEWLHRCAFHFGGAGKGLASSQLPSNFIVGTGECNTAMIRAENSITLLLSTLQSTEGTLQTVNFWKGEVFRRNFATSGEDSTGIKIPDWVNERKYLWLSLRLDYIWKTKKLTEENALETRTLNVRTTLDPFSRYAPLRVEAKLDDLLFKRFFTSAATLRSSQAPSTITGSFVIVGHRALFGIEKLQVLFETWQGPPLQGIDVNGSDQPSAQRATLEEDFQVSLVIPELQNTVFDAIKFRNVVFLSQNIEFVQGKDVGFNFDADWVIDEGCGPLHSILSTVLAINEPILRLHAGLGSDHDWNSLPSIHSFTLEGVFPNLTRQLIPNVPELRLTSIGVRLFAVRGLVYSPQPNSVLSYAFGLFGTMELDVKGSAIPLTLDYNISENDGSVLVSAELSSDWADPFGIKGFTLFDVAFSTSFSINEPLKSFNFDVAASFQYRLTQVNFSGSYSSGGDYQLAATVYDFNLQSICDFFESMFGDNLSLPTVDVQIGSATIAIDSKKNLVIALQNVAIDGHTAADASLALSPTGASLRGSLGGDISVMGITIKHAYLLLDFHKAGSRNETEVMLGGEVVWEGYTINAGVHIYPSGGEKKGLEYTIYGSISGVAMLSDLVHAVERDNWLDFAISEVSFVMASKDDPRMCSKIPPKFQVSKGIQVCATLHKIDLLDRLVDGGASGLVLQAAWLGKSFGLKVSVPSTVSIDLKSGTKMDPFSLSINTTPPSITIVSGIVFEVPPRPLPFHLGFEIKADITNAVARATFDGDWTSPFGIGDQLTIKGFSLGLGIIYSTFLELGPSVLSISGIFFIGTLTVDFDLELNQNPTKQLIYASITHLNLTDLVSFAEKLLSAPIPTPPNDFLDFQLVSIFICPSEFQRGAKSYPAGFSFDAQMTIMSHQAQIRCSVGSGRLEFDGSVDNFKIGPLSVSGTEGRPKATVKCALGSQEQYIFVDGEIAFFDVSVSVHVEAHAMPAPKFNFKTHLKFADALKFELEAELLGEIAFGKSLEGTDFRFHASLKQNIVGYIIDELMKFFAWIQKAFEKGIKWAGEAVDALVDEIKGLIARSQQGYDQRHSEYEKRKTQEEAETKKLVEDFNKKMAELEEVIKKAQTEFEAEKERLKNTPLRGEQRISEADDAIKKFNENREAVDSAKRAWEKATKENEAKLAELQDIINRNQKDANPSGLDSFLTRMGGGDPNKYINQAKDRIRLAKESIDRGQYYEMVQIANKLKGAHEAATKARDEQRVSLVKLRQDAVDALARERPAAEAALLKHPGGELASKIHQAQHDRRAYEEGMSETMQAARMQSLSPSTFQAYNDYADAEKNLEDAKHLRTNALLTQYALVVVKELEVRKSKMENDQIVLAYQELVPGPTMVGDTGSSSLFDVNEVELSGTLRGLLGDGNKLSKPLTAKVVVTVAGARHEFKAEFDPRSTVEFLKEICDELVKLVLPGEFSTPTGPEAASLHLDCWNSWHGEGIFENP